MAGVIFLFFIISLLFFIGAFHYLKLAQQSASYPPRHVVHQKAAVLAGGGTLALLIGILFYSFQ
ncbi:hypothetical protein [Metabacillus idriensis]|uniref:hypothetical protein n=1 Tax=Metabacillus idriensis TaxID=324768 RepID=UPI00174D5A28|nr:hypothetical protein [Metabacillus idriensis]